MSDSQLDSPLVVTDNSDPMPADDAAEPVFNAPEMVDSAMAEFFGFKPGDPIDHADRDYMQTIWNYYAEDAKSTGEVIRRISEAERGVVPPRFGETRLGQFYTYVRLLEEEKSVQEERSAYERP